MWSFMFGYFVFDPVTFWPFLTETNRREVRGRMQYPWGGHFDSQYRRAQTHTEGRPHLSTNQRGWRDRRARYPFACVSGVCVYVWENTWWLTKRKAQWVRIWFLEGCFHYTPTPPTHHPPNWPKTLSKDRVKRKSLTLLHICLCCPAVCLILFSFFMSLPPLFSFPLPVSVSFVLSLYLSSSASPFLFCLSISLVLSFFLCISFSVCSSFCL